MENLLKSIVESMEVYQNTYPDDSLIVVTDKEKIIGYLPGKDIRFNFSVGDYLVDIPHYQQTSIYKSLISGQHIREEHTKSAFGVPYISSSTPIVDEKRNIIGAITGIVSNKQLSTLRTTAMELAATTEEVSATSDELAADTNKISSEIQILSNLSGEVNQKINEISSILSFIRDVASQSNLLALNAMIEAARVGDQGKGFAVVASEMRKMSESSKQSSENIERQLNYIVETVDKMNLAIQQISNRIEKHSANTQELNAAFAQIASTTDALAIASKV
ncbi:MAG: methyl-accepting chemotaxis protein [Bacillota bacterium]|nr:methyl-accepting chemotaxis protein [Bacillota bacterium]